MLRALQAGAHLLQSVTFADVEGVDSAKVRHLSYSSCPNCSSVINHSCHSNQVLGVSSLRFVLISLVAGRACWGSEFLERFDTVWSNRSQIASGYTAEWTKWHRYTISLDLYICKCVTTPLHSTATYLQVPRVILQTAPYTCVHHGSNGADWHDVVCCSLICSIVNLSAPLSLQWSQAKRC